MFREFAKVLVLCAAVVAALASASTATATNWTSNGSAAPGTLFSASAGASRFEIHVTNPSHLVGTICTTSDMTGRLLGPTGPVNTGLWTGVATLRPSYSGCTAAGLGWSMTCAEQQLDAVSQAGTVVSGGIRGVSCTITSGGCIITVTGNLPSVAYNNATSVMIVGPDGLNASWPNTAACRTLMGTTAGGVASVAWGTNAAPPGPLSWTVGSPFKPNIQHN